MTFKAPSWKQTLDFHQTTENVDILILVFPAFGIVRKEILFFINYPVSDNVIPAQTQDMTLKFFHYINIITLKLSVELGVLLSSKVPA